MPCHSQSLLGDWWSEPAFFFWLGCGHSKLTSQVIWTLVAVLPERGLLGEQQRCQLNLGGTECCKSLRMVSLFSSKTTAVFVEFCVCVMSSLDEITPTYMGLRKSEDRCWHLIVRGLSCWEDLTKLRADHSLDWWKCLHISLLRIHEWEIIASKTTTTGVIYVLTKTTWQYNRTKTLSSKNYTC